MDFCDQTSQKCKNLIIVLIGWLQRQTYLWNVAVAAQELSSEAVKGNIRKTDTNWKQWWSLWSSFTRRLGEWLIALERGHWSAIITQCLYQHSYWLLHCTCISKMTMHMTIMFESLYLFVYIYWFQFVSYCYTKSNHHSLFFPSWSQIDFLFEDTFDLWWASFALSWLWLCVCVCMCVCVFVCFLIADFIHEQDRPFSRQDFALWTTPAFVSATVQR